MPTGTSAFPGRGRKANPTPAEDAGLENLHHKCARLVGDFRNSPSPCPLPMGEGEKGYRPAADHSRGDCAA
jgi:hypothetical protein